MGYTLAVDLGTTFTAAAVAHPDGPPTVLALGNRAAQIPSALFLAHDGTYLVGEAAERRGATEPERLVREFKRRVGDPVSLLVAGTPVSPQALTARLLRHVHDVAQERLGDRPDRLVVTHPANWGPFKLDVLRQAVDAADVGEASWCSEPEAAALQYAARASVPVGAVVAVYDLGGGTFDACVLRKAPDGFVMLGLPAGLEYLGGVDFDEALFQHVVEQLGRSVERLDREDSATQWALARLRRDCVEAKEALSGDVEVTVPVTLPGLTTSIRLTRVEFEALIRPALDETVRAMGRALRSADVDRGDLTAIVLVGGSSRIPLVSQVLTEAFSARVALDAHPKYDVALGAARRRPAPQLSAGSSPPGRAPAKPARRRLLEPLPRRGTLVGAASVGIVAVALAAWVIGGTMVGGDEPDEDSTEPSAQLPRSRPLAEDEVLVTVTVDGRRQLYLAGVNGEDTWHQLTSASGGDESYAATLSPDAATAVYLHRRGSDGAQSVRIAGAAGFTADRKLFDVPSFCGLVTHAPAWNPAQPDLLALACQDPTGAVGIHLVGLDGRLLESLRLAAGTGQVGDPTFSPEGDRLMFYAGPSAELEGGAIYVAPLDGEAPRQLSGGSLPGQDADPSWSPDGETVAFRRRTVDGSPGGNSDIYTIDLQGKLPERLTRSPQDEKGPTYSRDGSQLAYVSYAPAGPNAPGDVPRLWVMDRGRSTAARLLWPSRSALPQTAAVW